LFGGVKKGKAGETAKERPTRMKDHGIEKPGSLQGAPVGSKNLGLSRKRSGGDPDGSRPARLKAFGDAPILKGGTDLRVRHGRRRVPE